MTEEPIDREGEPVEPTDRALAAPEPAEPTDRALAAPEPPDRPLLAEPDGDLTFAPGAEVPLPPPPEEVPRCSWCSARLEDPAATSCPSCGAQLTAPEPVDVPGVTAIDPAILALANRPKPERRSLAAWLAGDAVDEYPPPTEAELSALARPEAAVRREMRRLELAALGITVEEEGAGAGGSPPPGESAIEADVEGEGGPPPADGEPPAARGEPPAG